MVLTAVMFLLLKLQIKTPTSNEEVTQAAEALKRITWLPWAGLVVLVGLRLAAAYLDLREQRPAVPGTGW